MRCRVHVHARVGVVHVCVSAQTCSHRGYGCPYRHGIGAKGYECVKSIHTHRPSRMPLPPTVRAEHLELGAMASSGVCLLHLAPLTRLRSLALGGAIALSGQGVASLARLQLPCLESLRLAGVKVLVQSHAAGAADAHHAGMSSGGGSDGGGSSKGASASRGSSSSDGGSSSSGLSSGSGGSATIDALLAAIGAAAPALQCLEVGSCTGLSPGGLSAAAEKLPALTHLRLVQQPLSVEQCQAALQAGSLKWFESAVATSHSKQLGNAFLLMRVEGALEVASFEFC